MKYLFELFLEFIAYHGNEGSDGTPETFGGNLILFGFTFFTKFPISVNRLENIPNF